MVYHSHAEANVQITVFFGDESMSVWYFTNELTNSGIMYNMAGTFDIFDNDILSIYYTFSL